MISIISKENTVVIDVEIAGFLVPFSFSRSSAIDAILLRDRIRDDLSNRMEQIRRESYEQGWKDAKSKKTAKQIHFWGGIKG